MNRPRISVGAIMGGLVVVAIDCVIYRSFASRPGSSNGGLSLILQATLPMANLLAFVLGSLVRGQAESRPGRIGFAVGVGVAMVATMVGLLPAFDVIESVLTSTRFDRWLTASPIREMVAIYGIVVGLPLLFQGFLGLVGLWIGRMVGARERREPIVGLPSRRFRFATLAALVMIVIVPAVAVEGHLRRKFDPSTTRLDAGAEAIIDLDNSPGGPLWVPKGSWIRRLDGARVRVESDREPFMIEQVLDSRRNETFLRDRRTVRVTILDGPRAGESVGMTYCLLRQTP